MNPLAPPDDPASAPTTDRQLLIFAHNPWEDDTPEPGDDPNSVSQATVVTTEGLPVVSLNPRTEVHECETVAGTFTDDDG